MKLKKWHYYLTMVFVLAVVGIIFISMEVYSGKKMKKLQMMNEVPWIDSTILLFPMVIVKGGAYQMAANNHWVYIDTFRMGQTEVTQGQWQAVMKNNPSRFKGADQPVENVSWEDVQAFIKKLNQLTGLRYRLPTEAEWEYAAGGGENNRTVYAGADCEEDLDEYAWYAIQTNAGPQPVASKRSNSLGLYDMSGNVWEWCQDWYDRYPQEEQNNPQGPAIGSYRVYRGGAWSSDALSCRVGCRAYDLPSMQGCGLGFRLALTP